MRSLRAEPARPASRARCPRPSLCPRFALAAGGRWSRSDRGAAMAREVQPGAAVLTGARVRGAAEHAAVARFPPPGPQRRATRPHQQKNRKEQTACLARPGQPAVLAGALAPSFAGGKTESKARPAGRKRSKRRVGGGPASQAGAGRGWARSQSGRWKGRVEV